MSSTNISILIQSAPSTSISYTPAQPSFTAPVPAGTVMGSFAVLPAGWAGSIGLSGADAASFTLNTDLQLVAAASLPAKNYALTASATP